MENLKARKEDRAIVLEAIPGKTKLSTTGLVDQRLFNGEANLHIVMDSQTTLWSFKYDRGILPEPLRNKFTSFSTAKKFAEEYFGRRNLQITKVID